MFKSVQRRASQWAVGATAARVSCSREVYRTSGVLCLGQPAGAGAGAAERAQLVAEGYCIAAAEVACTPRAVSVVE